MKIVIPRIIHNKEQLTWDWSGTITNIKKYLGKYEIVEEQNIFYTFRMNVHKVLVRLGIRKSDMNMTYIKYAENQVHLSPKDVCLTFDEFPLSFPDNPVYIYQDLNLHYLIESSQNNSQSFKYSGFQNVPADILDRRMRKQEIFYNQATGIFTMSKWFSEYLIAQQGLPVEKVHYVGAGTNMNNLSLDHSHKERNKFLFIGKDFFRKGGDLVYNAFVYLQNNLMPEAELYIIGPSDVPMEFNNPNVYFLGNLPADKVQCYYNLCDVFVLPSRFEAFGIVFVESLCYGLPCIGRDLMEMPNLIQNNETGLLLPVEEENPQVLADIMYNLIKNENFFKNVQTKQDYYKAEYSWDTVAKRMISIMKQDMNNNL